MATALLITEIDVIRMWKSFEPLELSWPEGSLQSHSDFFEENVYNDPHSYYPKPALEVLQEIAAKYRTLEWIPRRSEEIESLIVSNGVGFGEVSF